MNVDIDTLDWTKIKRNTYMATVEYLTIYVEYVPNITEYYNWRYIIVNNNTLSPIITLGNPNKHGVFTNVVTTKHATKSLLKSNIDLILRSGNASIVKQHDEIWP